MSVMKMGVHGQLVKFVATATLFALLWQYGSGACDSFNSSVDTVCPNDVAMYRCAVSQSTSATTFWTGDASVFTCGSNIITLAHAVPNAMDDCGSSTSAVIVDDTDNCFTSVLSVTASPAMDGATIQCFGASLDPADLVGSGTLQVVGETPAPVITLVEEDIADIPSEPDMRMVTLRWALPDNENNLFITGYTISVSPAAEHVSPPCTGTMSSCFISTDMTSAENTYNLMLGQTYSFTVFTTNCGDQNGGVSEVFNVTLQVPGSVTITCVQPEYDSNQTLLMIQTSWTALTESLQIAPGLIAEVTDYTVTYTLSSGGSETRTVSQGDCSGGNCTHQFTPTGGTPLDTYTVTVAAENLIGLGPSTSVMDIGLTNNFLSVGPVSVASPSEATVNCQFLSGFSGMSPCTAECGTDPTFTNLQPWGQSDLGTVGDTRVIPLQPPELLTPSTTYYCIISATTGNGVNVRVQVQFITPAILDCDPNVLGTVDSVTDSTCAGVLEGSVGSASIANGVVCYNGTIASTSVALYICDDGSQILIPGGTTNPRECLVDGTYSGSDITCVRNCDPNELGTADSVTDSRCTGELEGSISSASIDNGVVCYNGTTGSASVALYVCDDGFQIQIPDGTTNPRECQVDGMYSGSAITCSQELSSSSLSPTAAIGGAVGAVVVIVLVVLMVNLVLIVLLYLGSLFCLMKPSGVEAGKGPTSGAFDDKENHAYNIRPYILILLVMLVITIPFVIYFYCCWHKKSGSPKTDDKVELNVRTGSSPEATGGDLNYAVPGDIKREEYPGTHEQYTVVDKSRKKQKPEDALPPPQEAAPMYSEVGNSKKQPGNAAYSVTGKNSELDNIPLQPNDAYGSNVVRRHRELDNIRIEPYEQVSQNIAYGIARRHTEADYIPIEPNDAYEAYNHRTNT